MPKMPSEPAPSNIVATYRDVPTNFPLKDGEMRGSATTAFSTDGEVVINSLEQFTGRELPNRDAQLGRYTRTDGSIDCPFLHYRFVSVESDQEAMDARNRRVSVCVFYRLTSSSDMSWLRAGYRYPDSGSSTEAASCVDYIPEALLALDTMFGETAHRYNRFNAYHIDATETLQSIRAKAEEVFGHKARN